MNALCAQMGDDFGYHFAEVGFQSTCLGGIADSPTYQSPPHNWIVMRCGDRDEDLARR
jgi:hypothetical protein